MNWTGQGVVFPREKWLDTRSREAFGNPGVYVLYFQLPTTEGGKITPVARLESSLIPCPAPIRERGDGLGGTYMA
jgi:hypothetical protein